MTVLRRSSRKPSETANSMNGALPSAFDFAQIEKQKNSEIERLEKSLKAT